MFSHINSFFGIARALESKDVELIFAVPEKYCKYIDEQGHKYVVLDGVPFGLGYEDTLSQSEIGKKSYIRAFLNRFTNRIFIDRKRKLDLICNTFLPDYLFFDAFASTDLVILYDFIENRKAKFFAVQTMASTYVNDYCLPLSSSKQFKVQRLIRFEWIRLRLSKAWSEFLQKILYLGNSNAYIIRKNCRLQGVDEKFKINSGNCFQVAFTNAPEIVLVPSKFDLGKNISILNQIHLGYMMDKSRTEFIADDFRRKIEELEKKRTGQKVVFVSFGSAMLGYQNIEFSSLVSKIIGIALKNPDLFFIIAAPLDESSARFDNVWFVDYAPQLFLLKHSDLFITTGGLNSIKEAVVNNVPLLVFPWSDGWDRMGNARLIISHKIGLIGKLDEQEETIYSKMMILINDSSFKSNLNKCLNYESENVEEIFFEFIKFPKLQESAITNS